MIYANYSNSGSPTSGSNFSFSPKDQISGYTYTGYDKYPRGYVNRNGEYVEITDPYDDGQIAQYEADQAWKKANPSGYGPGGPSMPGLSTTNNTPISAPTVQPPTLYNNTAIGGTTASGGSVPTINTTSALPGMTDAYPLYLQAAATADPMAKDRSGYQSALYDLVQGGGSNFANDPSYQNRLKQGLEGVTRTKAAQGYLGSGNMLTALVDYAGDKASEEYSNQYNRLAQLAGVDKSSPTTAAQIMAQYPSQNLAEKSAQFSWGQQSAMLPYQLQQMAASSSAAANDSALAQAQLPYQLQAAALQNQLLNSQAQAALKQAQQNANSLF